MERGKPRVLRPVVWMGSSKKDIRDFPDAAQKLLGDELQLIQFGGMPKDAKPFKGVGSGVLEIALRYASDAYRGCPGGAGEFCPIRSVVFSEADHGFS